MLSSLDRRLAGLPRPLVAALGYAAVLLVGLADYLTPRELSLAVFNLLPVFAVRWYVGPRSALGGGILAGVVWFVADEWASPAIPHSVSAYWTLASKLAFFLAFTYLLGRLKEASENERRLARRDALTGAANRFEFFERAPRELAACRRRGEPAALAFVDVDDFKEVNDRGGHGAGDEILVAVAGALAAELRSVDVVARIGGDEFVVLLPGARAATARVALERVRERARRLPRPSGGGLSLSIGLAAFASPPEEPDLLVRAADRAMYRAKEAGKGNLVVDDYGTDAVFPESQNQ